MLIGNADFSGSPNRQIPLSANEQRGATDPWRLDVLVDG
jgi:hypothetical protein